MLRSRIQSVPPRFAVLAATIATAFAAIGGLLVAGAGPTPAGRIMAVVIGFVLLGVGAVLALAIAVPHDNTFQRRDDWTW
jgi:hypothetical protein